MIGDKGYGTSAPKGAKKKPAAKVSDFERGRFVARCGAVLELLQELPERAEDFADSSTSTVLGMMETAETRSVVSPKMRRALANIERGAERWKAGER